MRTALSQFLFIGAALSMAAAASGAVVMTWTAVPAHLAGAPGGAYGRGSRVLDVNADGQLDLLINESTVCTDEYVHLDDRSWPERVDTSLFQASSPIVQGWANETDADTPIEARLIPEPGVIILGCVSSVVLGLRRRRPFGGSAMSR